MINRKDFTKDHTLDIKLLTKLVATIATDISLLWVNLQNMENKV